LNDFNAFVEVRKINEKKKKNEKENVPRDKIHPGSHKSVLILQ
jgi:hypothetical protein